MKKILFGTFIAAAALVACKGGDNAENAKVATLKAWVDSVEANTTVYTDSVWKAYETKAGEVVNSIDTAKLDEAGKKQFAEVDAKWKAFEASFKTKAEEANKATAANDSAAMAMTAKNDIAKVLFEGATMADANDFSFLTGANCLATYEKFVATAKAKKDTWSAEQWNIVKALYESMDMKKNEIEKDMSAGDKLKVAKLKTEFAAMNTTQKIENKM